MNQGARRVGRGFLLVVSGPSGVGKNRLIEELRRRLPDVRYSVSATTRRPRPGEVHGVDYYFLSDEEFTRWIEEHRFLEWAEYCGRRYGTPLPFIQEALARGETVALDVETKGAQNIRARVPEAVLVFVIPPSLAELHHRLRGRGTDPEDIIRERLKGAYEELQKMKDYDYVILNDSLETAASALEAIVRAERCRVERSDYHAWLETIRGEAEELEANASSGGDDSRVHHRSAAHRGVTGKGGQPLHAGGGGGQTSSPAGEPGSAPGQPGREEAGEHCAGGDRKRSHQV